MTKVILLNFVKSNLSFEDKVAIVNAWEGWRSGEVYENVFDLFGDKEDIESFTYLYGAMTYDRCKKTHRFWVGGWNYYDDKKNYAMGRETEIFPVTSEWLDNMIKTICNTMSADILSWTESEFNVAETCFGNLIDFRGFKKAYNDSAKIYIVIAETMGTDGTFTSEIYPCHSQQEAGEFAISLLYDMAETMDVESVDERIWYLHGDEWWFRVRYEEHSI